ncbi:hypothetical protein [Rhodanobacter terrae]|uniref:Uncharacterized protein n=1 Tax=Rhodanobacter terrae TaxID=418647 RepID=A0ABW0SX83_9GAMM
MGQNEGNVQSRRLMEHLGKLVDGNHAQAHELQATGLSKDTYSVDAWVTWQFGHDSRSRTVHGNGAVTTHFGFEKGAFEAHLHALGHDAASNREIRVPFMQTVTVAAANSLRHSGEAQMVKEYDACSVHRQCGGCRGSGQVACSGCQGSGRRSCGSCGGSGSRYVSVNHTRWNGHSHESYVVQERQSCYGCFGSGNQVCGPCGGSGRQRCGSCSGQGYFTDIVETWALARPQWWVRTASGLAHELLQDFMAKRGAAQALDFVPSLSLLDTGYDDADRWVVHYGGEAEVIEQSIALRNQSWTVPAVGPKPVPMKPAPIFDYLLAAEIAHVRDLRGARKQTNIRARVARRLFHTYRGLPALDQATQEVAALAGASAPAGANTVRQAMQGFISTDAATDLGEAIQAMLHKISPPYSILAWALVMLVPLSWVAVSTAMNVPHANGWFDGAFGLAGELIGGCLGVLLLSPLAWVLSASISGLLRLRVPKPYRQKGRNWVPLRQMLKVVLLAALPGLLYGLSVRYLRMPPVEPAIRVASAWVPGHIIPPPKVLMRAQPPLQRVNLPATYRAIQHYLNGHGYPVGPEDGQLGLRTRLQIGRYLYQHHLSAALPPETVLADMLQRP